MDIEKLIPKKEIAEKIGISLQDIFEDIKKLSQEELIEHPREYILKGKITIQILKEIRKLGVEFSIAGEKDRLVFATGSVGNSEIERLKKILYYLPEDYPTNSRRYSEATYNMHSHDDYFSDDPLVEHLNNEDEKWGTVPSMSDLVWFEDQKNFSSIIFTSKGLVEYVYKKGEDAYHDYLFFVYETLGLSAKFSVGHFSEREFIYFIESFLEEVGDEKKFEIYQKFLKEYNVIVNNILWEKEEECQKLIDKYFKQ